MPDGPAYYGLSAGRFRDPRLQTGPFPQWPTLPPMPQPPPRYLENDLTAWEGGDFSSANATPMAIALGLAGARGGIRRGSAAPTSARGQLVNHLNSAFPGIKPSYALSTARQLIETPNAPIVDSIYATASPQTRAAVNAARAEYQDTTGKILSRYPRLPEGISLRQTAPSEFTAFHGDRPISTLSLMKHRNDVFTMDRITDPDMQRMGVASALQDYAEHVLGRPLNDSVLPTDEGVAYEQARNSSKP